MLSLLCAFQVVVTGRVDVQLDEGGVSVVVLRQLDEGAAQRPVVSRDEQTAGSAEKGAHTDPPRPLERRRRLLRLVDGPGVDQDRVQRLELVVSRVEGPHGRRHPTTLTRRVPRGQ